ncbi:hypothetical protein CY34DRAFT_806154 [Suillus luteus UH-Slu-Lm8-n1]|uniref:Uncharacterized protein n=1 Tax=Suillus luteus UH-Slu-Lm8-n1 TaxID=930992 RepID=A0A0C9ZTV0_9AGAM|nr:hypothetical protein CY34DRAFT_806154 [Suillus luteus UH-Slu-Lm8-n1]
MSRPISKHRVHVPANSRRFFLFADRRMPLDSRDPGWTKPSALAEGSNMTRSPPDDPIAGN